MNELQNDVQHVKLNKNLEIGKLTQQVDDLMSDYVDLQEEVKKLKQDKKKDLDLDGYWDDKSNLYHLLKEIHERMYPMMEHCERLTPVKLGSEEDPHYVNNSWDNDVVPTHPITIDITDEEEMMKTKLFRLDDNMVDEDQTTRSILKDLRKVIKFLQK